MIEGANPFRTEDTLVKILSSLPYASKVGLRQVCLLWKKILENISTYPLLNTNTILNAKQYLRLNDHNPQLTGYKKLITNYASLHPSDYSLNSLIIRFKCKWVEESPTGWKDVEPVTEILIPIGDVLLFASKFGKHDVQYVDMSKPEERPQRHQFITTYLNLPNTVKHPRSIFLAEQSCQSLARLKESLERYTDDAYKSLIPEIESILSERKKLQS
ncbi:MAG: hypothetical protein HYX61_06960 [Gammaproteobacteria bacterium]|jgi:hypothetical protein|nr:hypothetical protein [Gammaproteobacteria bacterium]